MTEMQFHVPNNIDAAREVLGSDIATAVEWRRAAIVYAFVTPRPRGGDHRSYSSFGNALSAEAFAKLGLFGLRSPTTVVRYHQAWANAIVQHGFPVVKPGDNIDMPDVPWESVDDRPRKPRDTPRYVKTGYARSQDAVEAKRLRDDGLQYAEIADVLGLDRTTAARLVREAEGQLEPPQQRRVTNARKDANELQQFQDACYRVYDAATAAIYFARQVNTGTKQSLFVEHGLGAIERATEVLAAIRDLMVSGSVAEAAEQILRERLES